MLISGWTVLLHMCAGALMGLIGAIAVTPTTFLLPPLFWIMFKKPPKWGWEWTLNASLVVVTAVLGVIGMVSNAV
jgi:hypothetical protein